MFLMILAAIGAANAVVLPRQTGLKVVLGNDDGWATSFIRSFYNSLDQAGYQVSLFIQHSAMLLTFGVDTHLCPRRKYVWHERVGISTYPTN
jgi:hypothetical protein